MLSLLAMEKDISLQQSPEQLISYYQLLPHPEGGYYKETYRSGAVIDTGSNEFPGARSYSTAIYFLLQQQDFSAFHRIKSDEIWHFYAGGPLLIHVIDPAGNLTTIRLGRNADAGETFQAVVPAGCWFASELVAGAGFTFVGCTVAPGFDFSDFELAEKEKLSVLFPRHSDIILRLTRQ